MKLKCQLFLISYILMSISAEAVTLKWDIPKDNRLEIVRTARVNYYVNSKIIKVHDERNIIDLTCYKKEKQKNYVKGVFSVYKRERNDDVFNLLKKYKVDFSINFNGKFNVDRKYLMPNLRNIPTFPKKDLKKGDTWQANGELVLDNFSRPFKLIFPVSYKLDSITVKDGKNIVKVKYTYLINKNILGKGYPTDFPVKIIGKDSGYLYWDIENRKMIYQHDKYRIVFIYRRKRQSFASAEFLMNIESRPRTYKNLKKQDKKKALDELKKELPSKKNLDVSINKQGLVVRMEGVLFNVDKYNLKKDTQRTLDSIIKVLKDKYPDREIIIEGHTDNTGNRNHNNRLSVNRAKRVAKYLRSRLGHDKLSYKGYGSRKPIANNETARGRKKNRRVELIIKLN